VEEAILNVPLSFLLHILAWQMSQDGFTTRSILTSFTKLKVRYLEIHRVLTIEGPSVNELGSVDILDAGRF